MTSIDDLDERELWELWDAVGKRDVWADVAETARRKGNEEQVAIAERVVSEVPISALARPSRTDARRW